MDSTDTIQSQIDHLLKMWAEWLETGDERYYKAYHRGLRQMSDTGEASG